MKILIADEMHPSLFPLLESHGWAYDFKPGFRRTDILAYLSGYDGLIIRSKTRIDEELLTQAQRLRFIARAGAGLDLIDVPLTERMNITLFHAGEGNRDAVAEHTLGMILMLFNNLNKADREVRKAIWDREGNRGVELMNKTVGIVGYGNNGSATARRLRGFGCKVLAYDKYRSNFGDEWVQEATLSQIQAEADVLSLHIPLTDQTRLLVNDSFIANFQKPFYLINVSRGEVVSLRDVVNGMKSGKILGACLDVLENEKLSQLTNPQQEAFDYLRTSDRVVLTPHIAGWSHESYVRINEVLVNQISAWLQTAAV
ncbi:2-hydroxyacid dehydrogenase [Arundinibacter roseus]|uniref:Phosphoglycerate dehydrogenase n=1 Tax=Arundinibacter roseus TaxID=2070510 RepID=A0A4R4K4T5_9BACT|nr:2-hydroxyacid dehydrogenase [Arundinibacter roseus]TDB61129.1 phosphoglycerate dehydrogenase [Arundinibacter roseus]